MPEINKRIAAFIPKSLPADAWSAAGPSIRSLVAAAEPSDPTHAKNLLSRLCGFLAGHPLWDRATAPDLAALLTADAIGVHLDQLTRAGRSPSTVRYVRKDLARLARTARGLAPRVDARRRRPVERVTADRSLVTLLESGLPAATAAAGWRQGTGRPIHEHLLTAVIRALAPAGEARAALAAAGDTAVATRPTATRRTAPTPRPWSRAAALREAKRALAVEKALAAGPVLADPPDDLPETVVAAIGSYRPVDVADEAWACIADAWRRLMSGYRPATGRTVSTGARHLVNFLLWCLAGAFREAPGPIRPEELLTPGLVDAWVLTLTTPASSKATARSMVRRAVASLTASDNTRTFAHRPASGPYSPAECAELRNLAINQPSPTLRRNLGFVIGLGAGAGLDSRDLRYLTRRRIHTQTLPDGTETLVVDVPGPRPRTVPVRHQYAPLVTEACRLHDETIADPDALIIGTKTDRTGVAAAATKHTATAIRGQHPTIDIKRLRATWLVALLSSPVPLAAILAAAGITTGRTITDLLPYCVAPEPGTVAAALAAAGPDQAGQAR